VRAHRRPHFRRNRGPEPSRFLSAQDINDQENDGDDHSDDDETTRFGEPFAQHSLARGFLARPGGLFSHNELHIEASCERVWKHIVEATKWPQWYPNSKDVQIMGGGDELSAGSVFRWTTFGLPLESRVNEFTPIAASAGMVMRPAKSRASITLGISKRPATAAAS
jgi:Polyketide cyclase / dehydrase and lipid transport